eukprot:Polyplicarium_translucidae@DN1314_c0_g1_i1.p1
MFGMRTPRLFHYRSNSPTSPPSSIGGSPVTSSATSEATPADRVGRTSNVGGGRRKRSTALGATDEYYASADPQVMQTEMRYHESGSPARPTRRDIPSAAREAFARHATSRRQSPDSQPAQSKPAEALATRARIDDGTDPLRSSPSHLGLPPTSTPSDDTVRLLKSASSSPNSKKSSTMPLFASPTNISSLFKKSHFQNHTTQDSRAPTPTTSTTASNSSSPASFFPPPESATPKSTDGWRGESGSRRVLPTRSTATAEPATRLSRRDGPSLAASPSNRLEPVMIGDDEEDEIHDDQWRIDFERETPRMKRSIQGRKLELNDFELLPTVGTGTFGRVRVVRFKDPRFYSIPLALKILKKSEVIRLKQVEHVKAEKDILLPISHPFIVNVLATFQDDRRLLILMEYVNGGELFSYLRREGKLDNYAARLYSAEIVLAFEFLHSLKVVYRDLKPENLLLNSHGHIKLTDFGFAKVVEGRTWTLCGTPEYLAPEIIQSKGHGKSVDWWALGILIFEMLAGYPPFYDENPLGIYQKVVAGKVEFPRHFDSRAKDLIKRLLAQDISKRYGCLRPGADDVKSHKWYRSIDWDACFKRELPVPFVPNVTSPLDTSMFDSYPESVEGSAPPMRSEEVKKLFEDF